MPIRLTRPLVFFDVETTGLDAKTARFVEISVAKHMLDGSVESKNGRFNSRMPIPAEAAAVHGITEADVAHEQEFKLLALALSAYLADCDLEGYDLPVQEGEFRRATVPFTLKGRPALDVMRIFYRKEPRNLTWACQFYLGRKPDGAHSAQADVAATVEIQGAMMAHYSDLLMSLPELCELVTDPGKLGLSGNLVLANGKPHMIVGKHAGKPLVCAANKDSDYLDWLLQGNSLSDTKEIVARWVARKYVSRIVTCNSLCLNL